MNTGCLILTQVTDLIHREQFNRCMALHPMPRASKGMTARDQFLAMAFAQITFKESLRDIEACLRGCSHLYGMGIRSNITRTNLAYANEQRGWRVYEALAQILIRRARRLYVEDSNGLDIDELPEVIGAAALDLLSAHVARRDFGFPQHCRNVMIPGRFVAGASLHKREGRI